MSRVINARTLLSKSTQELWDILTGKFNLRFDDGEVIETNDRETLYSSYAWDLIRQYPKTPILSKHHVKNILVGKRLGADTHLLLLGSIMWSVYDTYVGEYSTDVKPEVQLRDELSEIVYILTNEMYNDLSYRLEEFVTSLDITDFIEVLNHPKIKEANDTVEASQQSIDKTYNVIQNVLLSEHELPRNPLSLAARSKLVSMQQVLQCIGPRGYLTDTNSQLFKTPVLRGYAKGLRSFHDSLIESRSAAKSLIFSKSPLQQAEYFSRRLQLMTQIVQNLHHCDCGTTEYLIWNVKAPVNVPGLQYHPGDLKLLIGKYYLDEETNQLKAIQGNEYHLIGKTIKIRSPMHCAHPDPYGICSTCFGELSLSVPEGTNIGQMCCTSLAQKSSQKVMSIKHLDGSSVVDGIILTPYDKLYLKVADDDNSYLLADCLNPNKSIANKNQPVSVKLVIKATEANNITDILHVDDVMELNITRVSEITEIGILTKIGNTTAINGVEVNIGQRMASLTYPMLNYIKENGWDIDEQSNIVIDLEKWDWSKEILTLPLRHYSMSDHSAEIADMIESSVDKMQERDKVVHPDAALRELFDLTNLKLTVNLAVLEVVMYGSMIVSAENSDYSLPKPWTDRGLGVMRSSMANRSLSTAMAYEGHREILVNPSSYINVNRVEHPFDGLLMPFEVFNQ